MFDKEFEKYFEISVFQMVPIRTDNNLWKLITLRRSYHMVHGKYKVQGCVLNSSFFETGAMSTPTKSQNGTNCVSGGSFQSYLTHS